MYRSNNSLSVAANICICIFLLLIFSIMIEVNHKFKTLNNTISVLQSQVNHCDLDIELMKMEHSDLENTVYHNTELKHDVKTDVKTEVKTEVKATAQKNTKTTTVKKSNSADQMLLAQLIESEAGNQPIAGKFAVGTVVMNRLNSKGFPNTIRGVIYQKGQFSVVPNNAIKNKPSAESLSVAKSILNGKRTLKPNVLYFYNPKITSKKNWVRSRKVSKVIYDHVFAI